MAGEATLTNNDIDSDHQTQHNGSAERSTTHTGIKVLIVGAAFGGLCAAIECRRQGHDVEIYESFKELKVLGDIISFGANASRTFRRWFIPGTAERISDRLDPLSIKLQSYGFNIHKYDGELVMNQKSPPPDPEVPVFNGHRGEFHSVVYNYVRDDLHIPIHLGCRISKYFETESGAGIFLDSGEKVTADVVIGADGDPETRRFCENGDTFNGWIGPDVRFLFSTIKNGSDCCWVLTHVDDADIEESWSFPGKLEDVYKVFEGWDQLCKRIVSKTPEDKLVDWKLVYRDPLPKWVSDGG